MNTKFLKVSGVRNHYLSLIASMVQVRFFAVLIIISGVGGVFASDGDSNVYTVVVDGGTLASPVNICDQQVEIYDAEAGATTTTDFNSVSFKPNSIFRKRGAGYMISSTAMSGFTGEIRIEEGAFIVNTNNQIGMTTTSATAPLIVVSNGASFVMSTRGNTCAAKTLKIYNPIQLAGDGCDSIGAICNDNETAQTDSLFYGKWTLADDATVGSVKSTRFDISATIDMAGHSLTVLKVANSGIMCLNGSRCIVTNSTEIPSRIIVNGGTVQLQGEIKFVGDARSELVLTNNAVLTTWDLNSDITAWTMRLCGQHSIIPSASTPLIGIASGNRWMGPVVLDGSNVVAKFASERSGFVLTNNVSGAGRITANNVVLQLGNFSNSFSGSLYTWNDLDRTGKLVLWHPCSLPPTCAGLSVSNMPVTFVSKYDRYDLPPTDVYVREGTSVVFDGGSGGFAPSFRKAGEGQLELESPLTVTGRVEIADGTLKFTRYARAGLISGCLPIQNRNSFEMPDGNKWTHPAFAALESTCTLTNCVEIAPLCFTSSSSELYKAPSDGSAPALIVMYDGYIWNNSGKTQSWTFCGGVGANLNIWLDSTLLNRYTQYKTGVMTKVDVAHGAHRFRVTTYNNGANAYIAPAGGDFTNMTWKIGSVGAGLRYDPNGGESTNYADYLPIEDPGDGSLLTVSTNDTLTAVQDEPSFWTLYMGTDAMLDTFGNGIVVGDLEGVGTVTNSNAYFTHSLVVTNSWTVSAADVRTGGVLRMHVPLSFGDNVKFEAENLADFPRTDEPCVLCVADEPINGMPRFNRFADKTTRKWRLLKSADGRSIQFQYNNGFVFFCR